MYSWLFYIFIILLSILIKKYFRLYQLACRIGSSEKSLNLGSDTESIMQSMHDISNETSDKGGILMGWMGPVPFIILTDRPTIHLVLKHHLDKGDSIKSVNSVAGNGTLLARETIWKRRRKPITLIFNQNFVMSLFGLFLERSLKLVHEIAPMAEAKNPFSIRPYINSYSFDNICKLIVGEKELSRNSPRELFLNALFTVKKCLGMKLFNLWLQSDVLFRFHPNYALIMRYMTPLNNWIDEFIEKKRAEFEGISETYDDEKQFKNDESKTIFDLLVSYSKREKEYNNLELREEILSLFIAATDASANTIGFALKLLAKYPAVQEKVYAELRAAFPDEILPSSKDDLCKLEYMERVIKETLRLYPPGPFIIRKTNKEIITARGKVLPGNCNVVISIWGLHRNKNYWGEDADHFDPDRFLPERMTRVPTGSFIPFVTGPRMCPGYLYAMMSMKTALSVILKTYRVIPDPENGPVPNIKLNLEITLATGDDTVTLEKR